LFICCAVEPLTLLFSNIIGAWCLDWMDGITKNKVTNGIYWPNGSQKSLQLRLCSIPYIIPRRDLFLVPFMACPFAPCMVLHLTVLLGSSCSAKKKA
jgi:hypothetical protein